MHGSEQGSLEQTCWKQVRSQFQHIWGYTDFRPPQGEIIHGLLCQQDSLIVMPTGGGKSICFQLPALLQTGLTLVVSPLVALMENQVRELEQRHLPAAALHSELTSSQRRRTLADLERQRLRLLYLSPETLLSEPVWNILKQPHIRLTGLILDEAHCLVQWGETFRPAYRRLGAVRSALLAQKPAGSHLAIAAFTATADPRAQRIIQETLQLNRPQVFLLNPYRSNLRLSVQLAWTPSDRRRRLRQFIDSHAGDAGLVYVRTRRDSEALASWLTQQGYKTAAYHAGLAPDERRSLEAAWLTGAVQFVVCTSAFGMGINKPNVRWVVHFHAPTLLSEYVQEVGRAGRDGKPAAAMTLMSEPTGWLDPSDQQRWAFFHDRVRSQYQLAAKLIHALPETGNIQAITRQFKDGAMALSLLHHAGHLDWQDPFHYTIRARKLPLPPQDEAVQTMIDFLNTRECRWKFLLAAFGFSTEAHHFRCGHCDRCVPR